MLLGSSYNIIRETEGRVSGQLIGTIYWRGETKLLNSSKGETETLNFFIGITLQPHTISSLNFNVISYCVL